MNRDDEDTRNKNRTAPLDRAAAELDTTVTARLRAARLRAVTAAETRRARRVAGWLPLSAAVAATVTAVAVGVLWWQTPTPVTIAENGEDVEWLLAKESPELFSEQIEFYHWLEDDNDAS